jgi:DNA-binding MarR family transcriptional regulator
LAIERFGGTIRCIHGSFKYRIVRRHATLAPMQLGAEDMRLPRAAQHRPALLLAVSGARLLDRADEILADAGLADHDYTILAILATDAPASQQELARLLGKAPAIVVVAVDGLEARGLVTRTRDPADRRRSRVTLTERGRAALAKADELGAAAFRALFSGLSDAEVEHLGDLLGRGIEPRVETAAA